MKKAITLLACIVLCKIIQAQTKVFQEVDKDIVTQVKTLFQGKSIIGYVAFTTLEKASSDSFNYKITIMDENLNDIGVINFRDQKLILQDLSFEEDIICIGYVRSNLGTTIIKNEREAKKKKDDLNSSILLQYIGLDGKILLSNNIKVDAKFELIDENKISYKKVGFGTLKHRLQIQNIPTKGFLTFWGDEKNNTLQLFDFKGATTWKTIVKDKEKYGYNLLMADKYAYLLSSTNIANTSYYNYSIQGFDLANGKGYEIIELKDKNGYALNILGTLGVNPKTNNPYLAGYINTRKEYSVQSPTGKETARRTYKGVYTIDLNGPTRKEMVETYSYWDDESKMPKVDKNGYFEDSKSYIRFHQTFRDEEGNTFFAGSEMTRKTRVGAIISSVILAPTIIFPIWIGGTLGYTKYTLDDGIIVKQSTNKSISISTQLEAAKQSFLGRGSSFVRSSDNKSFFNVYNPNTKTNYLVMRNGISQNTIYNLTTNKVERTIAGNKVLMPAKEGHIMVATFDFMTGKSSYSIEAL